MGDKSINADADAYFESLIARVDEAVEETPEGNGLTLWQQVQNFHSLTGLCIFDPLDPFPQKKRAVLLCFAVVLQLFFSAIFVQPARSAPARTWFFISVCWFPIFFMVRLLMRRPDVSNKYNFYPWGIGIMCVVFSFGFITSLVLRSEYNPNQTNDTFVTFLIAISIDWIIEATLLAICILGGNPCMRTTPDDTTYIRDVGLDEDIYVDSYNPPFQESAKALPSVVDI